MALPKIDIPTYELTLPISKKKLTIRPYLVKEQKLLFMAAESGDKESIIRAIKQIFSNCVIGEIDIDSLPLVDIEYVFLHLRARSVGEVVDLKYKCENVLTNDETCNNTLDVSFNLLDIKLKNEEIYNDVVMITNDVGIKFKYPDYSIIEQHDTDENIGETSLEIILKSIDYIFEGDKIYYAKETSKDELIEFLDSLNQTQFKNIEKYFENLPVLNKQTEIVCSKCGYKHNITIEGIESFFV